MAEVVITTRVNNELVEKSINNFKDLKKEIRASKDELLKYAEGSDDFKRVQKNVSELQSSLKGLGDTTRIEGSGVERLTQSFNLLGEAFTGGDIEKGKIAMTGLGQAMKAIPIFLLIEGFQLLIQNFDVVTSFFKTTQTDVEELTLAIKLETVQNEALSSELKNQIDIMTAQGASIEDILAKKKELMELQVMEIEQDIKLNKLKLEQLKNTTSLAQGTESVVNSVLLLLGFQSTAIEQQTKIARERKIQQLDIENAIAKSEATINDLKTKFAVEEINATKKVAEEKKTIKKEAVEKEKEESNKDFEDTIARLYAQQDKEVEAELAKRERIENIQREQDDKEFKARIDATKKRITLAEQEAEREKQIKKAVQDATFTSISNGFNAANNISRVYYQNQLNQAKGNAQAETEIRKKQFEVEKAFSVARAVIDGIRSVQGALAQTATLGPAATVLAVSNGVLAAANVAAILATKFDGGSSASQTTPANTITEPPTQTAPSIPQFGESGSRTLEGGNNDIQQTNAPLTVRAYVVESEITQSQNIINREKRAASFG